MTQQAKTLQGWGAKSYDLVIGIDTGVNTGYAVWNKSKQDFEVIKTTKIHRAQEYVLELHRQGNQLFVRVEDARKATFGRNTKQDSYKQQGAGSAKRDAGIWEDFLTDHNIPFEMVRPGKAVTKMNKETFAKLTGYKGLTSNHSRDAALLVFKHK